MTYRDIVEDRFERQDPMSDDAATANDTARPALLGFTALEDRVIALAREDGLGTIEAPGLLERLAGIVFGLRLNRRALADPRLEALRQAVVITRHRHHLPDAQVTLLQSHGFTLRQIRTIETRALAG
ncbi:MAG TPA: hypothetical protein VGC10_00755 [Sphingomonas sp.]